LFARVAYGQSGEGEGLYPTGGVGYPDSCFFALWLLVSRKNSPRVSVETYLAHLRLVFAKNGAIWGDAPRSSPRGGLGFQGKAESPFDFINSIEIYISTANWGVGYVNNKINLEILSKGRSDVVVRCSKSW
jgi:hypothetical protein